MSDVLFLNASPRGPRSESLRIANAYLDAYRAAHPGAEIDRLDLFDPPLPAFATDAASAKMEVIAGEPVAPEHAAAWAQARETADRLIAAHTVLAAVPMWNGGIPWALKLFIDTVTQPGTTFAFDPTDGYSGLLTERRAVVAYTSYVYSPGVPAAFGIDHHSTYFGDWLRFVGIEEIEELRLQTTFPAPDLDARRETVLERARELGSRP